MRDWVRKDPIAQGLAAQWPQWHQAHQSSICGREEYSPYFLETLYFFVLVGWWPRKQASEVIVWLARGHLKRNSADLKEGTPSQQSDTVDGDPHLYRDVEMV